MRILADDLAAGCLGDLRTGGRHRSVSRDEARWILGWPIFASERRRRGPRCVVEEARLVAHAPGIAEPLVEIDVALMQIARHRPERRSVREGGQPAPGRDG